MKLSFGILFLFFVIKTGTSFDLENNVFDYIVVGGGTAGCVIAARLAESGQHSILLIEDGALPNPNLEIPALMSVTSMYNYPNELKFYQSVPQKNAGLSRNGIITQIIGKTMGGGSSINGMFWNRGHPEDYNTWGRLTNDPGWNYQNMLKYFKKSENYSGVNPTNQRGFKGPVSISHTEYYTPAIANLIQAAQEIGYPVGDANGPQSPSITRIDLAQSGGRRVSSFSGYIKPLLERTNRKLGEGNLSILLNTEVKKIIFEGQRAIGVTFSNTKMGYARARKEIILCAGTMDSPAILMRSGIGPGDVLRGAKIPIVKELPVGKTLQDHVVAPLQIIFANRSALLVPSRDLTPAAWNIYEETGNGPYSSHVGMAIQGYFTSGLLSLRKNTNREDTWADIQFIPFGMETGSLQTVPDLKENEVATGWSPIVVRPKSVGSVKLNPQNPDGPPLIDFGFFTHPDDEKVMKDAIKHLERLCEKTKAMRQLGCRLSSTPIPSCSHFNFRSDAYWTCYIRQQSSTAFHASGTCKMGSGPEAVVDSQLKVVGVEGLRVADASVMPQLTNSNTQAPVFAIAEKAADMILQSI